MISGDMDTVTRVCFRRTVEAAGCGYLGRAQRNFVVIESNCTGPGLASLQPTPHRVCPQNTEQTEKTDLSTKL